MAQGATQLAELRQRLARVRHDDQSTWAIVARDTAGILASLSLRTEPLPGPLAEASRAVARSAQLRAGQVPGRPHQRLAPTQITAATILGQNRPSSRRLTSQLISLTRAIRDMHQAAGELDRARELEAGALIQLESVTAGTPASPGSALAGHAHERSRPGGDGRGRGSDGGPTR